MSFAKDWKILSTERLLAFFVCGGGRAAQDF
jgi:hypothetical protein